MYATLLYYIIARVIKSALKQKIGPWPQSQARLKTDNIVDHFTNSAQESTQYFTSCIAIY